MFSLLQTTRNGYKKEDVPGDEYEWGAKPLWGAKPKWGKLGLSRRAQYGVKRVETKRFVRFEYIRVLKNERKHGYWFHRKSYWFITVPFVKHDKELLIDNIAVWFSALPSFMRILGSLMSNIINYILKLGT